MKVLVTGSEGFIGKHMCTLLKRSGHEVLPFDLGISEDKLKENISNCDIVIHLAGVNRPLTNEEFYNGNTNFTKKVVDLVLDSKRNTPIIMSSSIQAALDNDYGKSKKKGEDLLFNSGLPVYVYRLANVFGRFCRPNYNSAAATFAYNIAHDLPIEIRDRNYVVHYNYVNDICEEWLSILSTDLKGNKDILSIKKVYDCSLGHLADLLYYFKSEVESDRHLPLIHDEFELKLFKTMLGYMSEINEYNFASDSRGSFEELYKSNKWGQISENISLPNITKGGHYHTYKKEIFYTVKGECEIKQRNINTNEIKEVVVSGNNPNPVDIIPYYTHSIKNIGEDNSVTIMWISELYNPLTHDTYKADL